MTADLDLDRLVRGWLVDGPTEVPDDVLRDVLVQLPTISQRRRAWPWDAWVRPTGSLLGFASAAAVALVVLGVVLLNAPSPPSVGPGPTSSSSATPSAEPSPTGTPGSSASPTDIPQPSGSSKTPPTNIPGQTVLLEPSNVTYPEMVMVGDPLVVEVAIQNRGDLASEPIELRFADLGDYAKLVQCVPGCSTTTVYGELRIVFGTGVAAGASGIFKAEFKTTKAGDVQWAMTVGAGGRQPFLANGHTYISPPPTLTPTIAPPPSNDAPPGVVITTLPFSGSANVTLAQIHAMEPSTPCGSGSKSVWYSYTAVTALTVVADTSGSDYDTVLDIWRGSLTNDYLEPGFETLQLLACNDNAGTTAQSVVVFAAEAGQSYVIRVTSKDGGGGNLKLNLAAE